LAHAEVKFFLHPDGSVVPLPKLPIKALKLKGIGKPRHPPATVEDMESAVIAGANEGISRGPRR
jgi:antitoxin PrlF